ncbi:MAG: hypothetical protein C0510_14165 [Erythrobacter sp.]|nr:hypothetical protein [Erythrobacter sp.]
MTAAIAITALNVNRGGLPIVQDVSAAVMPASWFGVIGANGSGKTTLLRAIAGRLPIAQGRCVVFGEECAQNRGARAQAIGFAPPIEHFPASLRLRQLLELAGDPIEVQHERNGALVGCAGAEGAARHSRWRMLVWHAPACGHCARLRQAVPDRHS